MCTFKKIISFSLQKKDIIQTPISRCYSKHLTNNKDGWKSVVGLEIHAQIDTQSKLFSGSSTAFGSSVNSNVSLYDAAIPGTLPVLNIKCVELGALTALALGCQLNEISLFERKHYFYADLPSGYQITQQRQPLAVNGILEFPVFNPSKHKAPFYSCSKIIQLQLEQDSGKSLHDTDGQRSLIDLDRAGVGLMEIVFAPDLSCGEEAAALVKELVLILTTIQSSSCKMEEGALRVDANVSIQEDGEGFGTRTEIKNIGSIRGVASAIDYEIKRQLEIVGRGGEVVKETRSWDALSSKTLPMREKEVQQDYRFMFDSNLPPLRLSQLLDVTDLKIRRPLPQQLRDELKSRFNLRPDLILHLVSEENLYKLFTDVMRDVSRDPKTVACFITIDLMAVVNRCKLPFTPGHRLFDGDVIGEIIDLMRSDRINLLTGRLVLDNLAEGSRDSPTQIIDKLGLWQIVNPEELKKICLSVIDGNPKIVEKYKKGQTKVFPALMGIVAEKTKNCAKMEAVSKIMKELLKK